jgi:sterol desaturase/sphingolipid hydroxylase (fatty acid hydroxylase superfamily)
MGMVGERPSRLAYWLDYMLFTAFIPMVAIADHANWSWIWLAVAIFGMIAFTYIEYWTHRVVLHKLVWHSIHARHHKHPEEYVTFPIWVMPGSYALMLLICLAATGSAALWVGFSLGYLWFISWHHVLHHLELARLPAPVRRYAAWHDRHHEGLPCNYGITHPFWDIVHGTSR